MTHELFPGCHGLEMAVTGFGGFLVHLMVDLMKEVGQGRAQTFPFYLELLTRVSNDNLQLTGFKIAHSEFETDGCSLHLPLVELVARVMSV